MISTDYSWNPDLEEVKKYHIYEYQHVDELGFLINPKDVISDKDLLMQSVNVVKNLFRDKGWEGDGEIRLIWLPPFLHDRLYPAGDLVWHVKQRNNGTSFIASKYDLRFLDPINEQAY